MAIGVGTTVRSTGRLAPLCLENHLAERAQPAGHEDARHFVVLAHLPHRVGAIGGIEALEIADFAVAEDEHAPFAQVFVEPCEREAGLLHVWTQDAAIEAAAAGEKLEIQPQRFGTALKKFADRHACAHCSLAGAPGTARPRSTALMLFGASASRALERRVAGYERTRQTASARAICL